MLSYHWFLIGCYREDFCPLLSYVWMTISGTYRTCLKMPAFCSSGRSIAGSAQMGGLLPALLRWSVHCQLCSDGRSIPGSGSVRWSVHFTGSAQVVCSLTALLRRLINCQLCSVGWSIAGFAQVVCSLAAVLRWLAHCLPCLTSRVIPPCSTTTPLEGAMNGEAAQ